MRNRSHSTSHPTSHLFYGVYQHVTPLMVVHLHRPQEVQFIQLALWLLHRAVVDLVELQVCGIDRWEEPLRLGGQVYSYSKSIHH